MTQPKKRLTYLKSNAEFKHVYEYAEKNGTDIQLIQNGKDPVNVLKRK